MRRRFAFAVVALVLSAASCGGSDSTTGPTGNNGAACTVTITGAAAIAGTYSCVDAPFTLYSPTTNTTAFTMSISGSKAINGTLLFTGVPSTSPTYTNQGSATLGPHAYQVTFGQAAWVFTGGQQPNPLGSYSLKFSSVTSSLANVYATHGTLDVNLIPAVGSSATGTAAVHVVF